MFEYYCVDWLMFAVLTSHVWLLAYKIRSSFLLGAFGSFLGIIFGIMTSSTAVTLMNVLFCLLQLRAYYMWSDKDEVSNLQTKN